MSVPSEPARFLKRHIGHVKATGKRKKERKKDRKKERKKE